MKEYQTDNLSLSVTLATCGVPHWKNEAGKSIPVYNIYDKNILAKLGYRGWDIEKATEDAFKKGIRGRIIYSFQHTEQLEEIVKTWDSHCKMIKDAEDIELAGNGDFEIPMDNFDIPIQYVARICCQYAKNRKTLAEQWRHMTPLFVVNGEFKKADENGKTVVIGSFRCMSVGASEEIRNKLGL